MVVVVVVVSPSICSENIPLGITGIGLSMALGLIYKISYDLS